MFVPSLKERINLKGLLKVVSSSAEFESIPIRRHEELLLRRVYDWVPVKLDHVDFEAPHFKILPLQARDCNCCLILLRTRFLFSKRSCTC